MAVEHTDFIELNSDQRRETVNAQQRYAALREAEERMRAVKGSMSWAVNGNGAQYLARSYYDKAGIRRQTSLGPRSAETEAIKIDYETGRDQIERRYKDAKATMERQSAVNRALRLGRVPLVGARLIRAVDRAGLLGAGLRVVGTTAIFAYEAVAGVHVDAGILATGDIDFLMDSRRSLKFVVSEDISDRSLMTTLRSVDKSFERTKLAFRAQNNDGYLVDLIKPLRQHPAKADPAVVGDDKGDLTAAEIDGLVWLENAPSFESVAIDERGQPLRIVSPDPRIWAAHKFWVSSRLDREPIKKQRDLRQAQIVGQLVADYLPHLPYEGEILRMLPKDVYEVARPLFAAAPK